MGDGGELHVALLAVVLADPLVVILDVGAEFVGPVVDVEGLLGFYAYVKFVF